MGRNGMKKERTRRRKEEMKEGRARHGRARQCVPSTGEYDAPLPLPDDRPLGLDCDCDPPVPLGAKRAYASRSAASLSSAACRCARASASGSCRNRAGIALCGAGGSSPLPEKPSNSVSVPGASTSAAASRRIPLRTFGARSGLGLFPRGCPVGGGGTFHGAGILELRRPPRRALCARGGRPCCGCVRCYPGASLRRRRQ
ncbi:hypothetical protein B0H14DRAFT_289675 [Mycena olivaceomarginata]|nr:hypothetical protein B0H14DRAFT_289675 [Mycena olivaceomarginata]